MIQWTPALTAALQIVVCLGRCDNKEVMVTQSFDDRLFDGVVHRSDFDAGGKVVLLPWREMAVIPCRSFVSSSDTMWELTCPVAWPRSVFDPLESTWKIKSSGSEYVHRRWRPW
jgi:hypothetical protein